MKDVVRPMIEASAERIRQGERHRAARLRELSVERGARPGERDRARRDERAARAAGGPGAARGQQHRGRLRPRHPGAARASRCEVPEGGVVALLGANGAGKTTTLKAISNLLRAERGEVTKGTIELAGQNVAALSPTELVRRGVVQVMEGRHCFEHLTVEENLLTGAYTRTRRQGRDRRATSSMVYGYFPRLRERRRAQAGYTSGGEQQMTAIGRALMARPKVILLDEPSMGLAPQLVEEIFEIVARLNAEAGVTFLLAEQNTNVALRYAELRLHPGERAGGARRRRRRAARQRGRQGVLPRPQLERAQELPRHQELQAPQALALGTSAMIGSHPQASLAPAHRARRWPRRCGRTARASAAAVGDGRIRRVSDLLIDGIADQQLPDSIDRTRLRSPHSAAALAVNSFLPWRRATDQLPLAGWIGLRCRPVRGALPDRPARHAAASRPAGAARGGRRSRSRCAASSISAGARSAVAPSYDRLLAATPGARALASAARAAARRARRTTATSTSAALVKFAARARPDLPRPPDHVALPVLGAARRRPVRRVPPPPRRARRACTMRSRDARVTFAGQELRRRCGGSGPSARVPPWLADHVARLRARYSVIDRRLQRRRDGPRSAVRTERGPSRCTGQRDPFRSARDARAARSATPSMLAALPGLLRHADRAARRRSPRTSPASTRTRVDELRGARRAAGAAQGRSAPSASRRARRSAV